MDLQLVERLRMLKEEERRVIDLIRKSVLESNNGRRFHDRRLIMPFDAKSIADADLNSRVYVVKVDSPEQVLEDYPKYRITIEYAIQVIGREKGTGNIMDVSAPSEPKPVNGTSSPSPVDIAIMNLVDGRLLDAGYDKTGMGKAITYRKELFETETPTFPPRSDSLQDILKELGQA